MQGDVFTEAPEHAALARRRWELKRRGKKASQSSRRLAGSRASRCPGSTRTWNRASWKHADLAIKGPFASQARELAGAVRTSCNMRKRSIRKGKDAQMDKRGPLRSLNFVSSPSVCNDRRRWVRRCLKLCIHITDQRASGSSRFLLFNWGGNPPLSFIFLNNSELLKIFRKTG